MVRVKTKNPNKVVGLEKFELKKGCVHHWGTWLEFPFYAVAAAVVIFVVAAAVVIVVVAAAVLLFTQVKPSKKIN